MILLATVTLGLTLLWLSIEDFRSFRLPDLGTLPLVIAGLGLHLAIADATPFWLYLLAAALGFISLWAVSHLYRHVRNTHGLGLGDAKLLAAAGAWLGPLYLAPIVLIGAIFALLYVGLLRLSGKAVSSQTAVPFGPFLSAAFFLLWCLVQLKAI